MKTQMTLSEFEAEVRRVMTLYCPMTEAKILEGFDRELNLTSQGSLGIISSAITHCLAEKFGVRTLVVHNLEDGDTVRKIVGRAYRKYVSTYQTGAEA